MHAELYKSNVMFSTKTTTFYINGQPRILDSFKNSLTLVKKNDAYNRNDSTDRSFLSRVVILH